MNPHVVAAIDSSAAARPVLEWAALFGRALGCSVEALHVSEDGDDTAVALASAAEVPLRTLTGDVIAGLRSAAEDPGVLALVLGGRGLPGGPRPAGHVALELITQVWKPVILVPPDVAEPPRLRCALLPLEGTPDGGRVPESVLGLLADAGIRLAAVHVDDNSTLPAYSDQVQHETEVFTHEFIARNVPNSVDVDLTLRVGQPGRELLAASREATSDLIVIAWSRDLSPGRAQVVRELLERSQVPVLLVPVRTGTTDRDPRPYASLLPDQEETQTDTIAALRRVGFTEDFHVDGRAISATGHAPRHAPPEEFRVVGAYRFEGASDPDDEAIVLALVHEPTGQMGTFDAAFGPGGSADEASVLTRLPPAARLC